MSYSELLRALSLAAVDGRGVTPTRIAENVYLKLTDAGEAGPTRDSVADLIGLELALRDRLEAVVARRYLELHGPDHVVSEATPSDDADETTERMRI